MDRVFELYVANDDLQRSASLTLPASVYEMVDVLEQVGSEDMDSLYFEIEKYHKGRYLAEVLESGITIRELNILAWRIAEMEEGQEAILEGLVKMEAWKQDTSHLPYLKLLQLTENTDCCHWVEEARNDRQLGRFYAENGFVAGADDLSDELFRLLDFEKIGRGMRLAEGGVFTQYGYVFQHDELRELTQQPDTSLIKPQYTIQLEICSFDENTPAAKIELPGTPEQIGRLQAGFLSGEYFYRCTDCAIPFFRETINESDAGLNELNCLARKMDFAQEQGLLPKYKALLLATGCHDVEMAAELGTHSVMAKYRFLPPQGDQGIPYDYARQWLEKKLGKDAAFVPDRDLETMGLRLMERDNVIETEYGIIQRTDRQPIQGFDLEQAENFQMQGMGGML